MLEQNLLNEKTVSPDVSRDLTAALAGSFEQQCVYLHNKTMRIDGIDPAFKSFGEFLANIEMIPNRGIDTLPVPGIPSPYPREPRESDKNFVFSKDNVSEQDQLINNYVELSDSKQRLANFAAYCLSRQGGTSEFGSAGDVMEFVMSNLLASFYSGTVLNKTDTAQGQDIVLENDDTYFEVKYTEAIKSGVKQVPVNGNQDEFNLDLYQFFYESKGEAVKPPSKPQLKTGATPPTANPKKFFILVTLGRSYLIRSDILANFLFTSKGLVPVNLDPNDFENINRIEDLKLLVRQRIDIAEKIRDFISVENQEHMYTSVQDPRDSLIDYEEGAGAKKDTFTPKIESDLFADGFIDFLNHNKDCRKLFLAFMFGTAMLTFSTPSISSQLRPLSEEVAKARAHEAIQSHLSGPKSAELTERVSSLLRSEDSQSSGQLQRLQRSRNQTVEQKPLIDFREDSTLLIDDEDSFNYYLDLMPSFFTLFGVTFSKEEGYITPPTPQSGVSSDTMKMSSRLSTMISSGGTITGVLADEKMNLGVKIAFLTNLPYVPEIASSEELEASFRNVDVRRNFLKPIKDGVKVSGLPGSYNESNASSKAILAAELMRNKEIFFKTHREAISARNNFDFYFDTANLNKTINMLFKAYIEDVSSPLNDYPGARPFKNEIDLIAFEKLYDDYLDLFDYFSSSYPYRNYQTGYEKLKSTPDVNQEFNANLGASRDNVNIHSIIDNLSTVMASISGKGSQAKKEKIKDEIEEFEFTMSDASRDYEWDNDEFNARTMSTGDLTQPSYADPFTQNITANQIKNKKRSLSKDWKRDEIRKAYINTKTGEAIPYSGHELPDPTDEFTLKESLYQNILKDIMEAAKKKSKCVKRR